MTQKFGNNLVSNDVSLTWTVAELLKQWSNIHPTSDVDTSPRAHLSDDGSWTVPDEEPAEEPFDNEESRELLIKGKLSDTFFNEGAQPTQSNCWLYELNEANRLAIVNIFREVNGEAQLTWCVEGCAEAE